jgi:DNA modification methylase
MGADHIGTRAPFFRDDAVTLYEGDCLEVLIGLPDASVDAVITDPPYALDFMGRRWDGTEGFLRSLNAVGAAGSSTADGSVFQRWCQAWAAECLRVLKPGGHLVAFGGTRTWHRLTCAIEDAGFDLRDSLAWLYGSGYPKSLNVSKAIDKAAGAIREVVSEGAAVKRMIPGADQNSSGSWIKDNGRVFIPTETAPATDAAKCWQGWGTALKPSFEPVVVARKPLCGNVIGNVLAYGTGALNIDGCRVNPGSAVSDGGGFTGGASSRHEGWARPSHAQSHATQAHTAGRWPSNVLLDDSQAAALDAQSGMLKSGKAAAGGHRRGTPSGQGIYGGGKGLWSEAQEAGYLYGDEGGASRFFPTFYYAPKAGADERPVVNGVQHPTVKPIALMRWLIRLVTPPGGVVLDPFGGSGATAEAAILEHKQAILIENEPDYLPLIVARLSKPMAIGFDFGVGA